jgi:hypothetical protein
VALGLDENSSGLSTPAPEKPLPTIESEGVPNDLGFTNASVQVNFSGSAVMEYCK